MTPRSSVALKQQRPLSAIYIGSIGSTSSSTPPDLPRLPEPPVSPGGSSNASASGLPSPPATNSTGSGSVGDDGTAHAGSQRERSSTQRPHVASAIMYDESPKDLIRSNSVASKNKPFSHRKAHSVASSGLADEEDDLHDNENDEDATARFDSLSRRRSGRVMSPPRAEDHSSALQRVKSLTERNRMVRAPPYIWCRDTLLMVWYDVVSATIISMTGKYWPYATTLIRIR